MYTMSGYRCVNYYELCRLCTASHGIKKVNIFGEEGRRCNLYEKIAGCLPIDVSESDKLPKIICTQCLSQVETFVKFRETCINAQAMLESCINSSKLRNGSKVYIKDVSPKKAPISPPLLKTITNSNTPITIGHTTLTKTPVQNSKTSSDFLSSIIQSVGIQNIDDNETQVINNIQTVQPQQQPMQQYTITLDGKTFKSNQIHYKIEPTGTITIQEPYMQQIQSTPPTTPTQQLSNSTLSQVNEFLKMKPTNVKTTPEPQIMLKRKEPTLKLIETTSPSKKPKINLVLASAPVQTQQHNQQPQQAKLQTASVATMSPANTITMANHTANKTQTITLQDLKFLSSGNKCYLPITLKDGEQQVMAQIDTKNIVFVPQQMTTVDGQQVVQLTSASNLPGSLQLAPHFIQTQQQSQDGIQQAYLSAGGQNITITQSPVQQHQGQQIISNSALSAIQHEPNTLNDNKIQFTTLQSLSAPITLPMPETSAITFQRIKVEGDEAQALRVNAQAKANAKPHVFKLPTLSNVTTATTTSVTKTITPPKRKPVVRTFAAAKPAVVTKTAAVNKPAAIKVEKTGGGDETATAMPTTTTTTTLVTVDTSPPSTNKSDVPTCHECHKVFKRKEHLAQHLKLHLGLRPFKCSEPNCNKAFSRKEHLMRHVVSHTGKKQFDCNICHKLFSRKDNLNKHKKSHEQKQQIQQGQPTQMVGEEIQLTQQQLVYTVTEVQSA